MRTRTKGAKEKPKAEAKIPAWAHRYIKASLDAHDKLMQITRLSAQGISMHLVRPKAIRVLHRISPQDAADETAAGSLANAEKDATLAQAEIDKGFPVLHGLAAIGLWGWFEDFVKGLVAEWFLHRPAALKAAAVQRLKVRVGDYLSLTKAEQALFLVQLLEQDLSSPLKRGGARFNSLLEVVGLDVELESEVGRALFELQQVRNNLAHRNGRADARLISECPWLGLKKGEALMISTKMMTSYHNAAGSFLLTVLYKVGDMHGMDLKNEALD